MLTFPQISWKFRHYTVGGRTVTVWQNGGLHCRACDAAFGQYTSRTFTGTTVSVLAQFDGGYKKTCPDQGAFPDEQRGSGSTDS